MDGLELVHEELNGRSGLAVGVGGDDDHVVKQLTFDALAHCCVEEGEEDLLLHCDGCGCCP